MRKSSAQPYEDFYLDALADQVLNAYSRNRKNGISDIDVRNIDVSKPPKDPRNPYYGYFVVDISRSTEKTLANGTVFKLLGRGYSKDIVDEARNRFEDYSIDAFEEYANTIQVKKGPNIKVKISNFQGVL